MEEVSILVVDDEPGLRAGVERALRSYSFELRELGEQVGCRLQMLGSGEEALEAIEKEAPDIILLDHQLPGISGMEVLEQLRKRQCGALVIVITAYASIETAVRAIKQGAHDFLAKPFTPAELRVAVEKAASRLVLARHARRLVEEKRQVRFEFIRVLGHELKAPLGAVESLLGLVSSRTLGSELAGYDEILSRASLRLEQMRKLIIDLLDMTRIESGQRAREMLWYDFRDLAAGCLEMQRPQAEERQIALSLSVPTVLRGKVDRVEIEMVLNNLISNAIKYNRDGGRVEIEIEPLGDAVQLRVRDTGPGISAAGLAKLFGEFVRIRTDENRHVMGSGLGLSIVRKIAALYGGTASAESEPGRGSCFKVLLRCELEGAVACAAA